MNGPDYYRAAARELANAERQAKLSDATAAAAVDRHLRLSGANAVMARLALDVAKAVAAGDLIEGLDIFSDEDEIDPLAENADAWLAVVTEGGAS